jgi:hypothetical protein
MRHLDTEIRGVGDLVAAVKATCRDGLVWFRGQERADWTLIPSVTRPGGNLDAELTTIKRFKQSARPYLPQRPEGDWEWIFLMQHHRAPTRLLDWSESPLVGLFFATHNPEHDAFASAVWCLDPVALNRLAGHHRSFAHDILAFGIDNQLDEYLPDKVNARVTKLNPVAAIGPRNSARMVAQAGTFTVIHAENVAIEAIPPATHVWRFTVPANAKADIREELRLIGITEYSLFPDLDRVALLVKELVS